MGMCDVTDPLEIRPGASRRRPIAETVAQAAARARCTRPHKDPDPCYDIEVPAVIDDPRWSMPRVSKTRTETVHIPGCMGCAVYGHERCHCAPRSDIRQSRPEPPRKGAQHGEGEEEHPRATHPPRSGMVKRAKYAVGLALLIAAAYAAPVIASMMPKRWNIT